MSKLEGLCVYLAAVWLIVTGTGVHAQTNRVTSGISPPEQGRSQSAFLTGGITSFGILTDEIQSKLGIVCKKNGSGIRISQVRPGSDAYYKNLQAGDGIVDARADDGRFVITIERDGRLYQAQLGESIRTTRLDRESATFDSGTRPAYPLQSNQFQLHTNSARQMNMLANYDLELIMDRSLSMRRRDCPGGLSRWDWSAFQAAAMAKALAPLAPRGLTITRFATDFDVHENTQPPQVVSLLSRHDFQLGTRLCEALTARLDHYFATRRSGDKPLLIAVITDGCPFPRPEPRMVINELVSASQRMTRPDEITIVFLQLGGDDPRGRNYLLNLADNLGRFGARYQFVRTKCFEEVESTGLAQALVDSVSSIKTAYRER